MRDQQNLFYNKIKVSRRTVEAIFGVITEILIWTSASKNKQTTRKCPRTAKYQFSYINRVCHIQNDSIEWHDIKAKMQFMYKLTATYQCKNESRHLFTFMIHVVTVSQFKEHNRTAIKPRIYDNKNWPILSTSAKKNLSTNANISTKYCRFFLPSSVCNYVQIQNVYFIVLFRLTSVSLV